MGRQGGGQVPAVLNFKISNFPEFQKNEIFNILISKKYFLKMCFFRKCLFFIKVMLIRFSLVSSDPGILPDTVHLLSDTEPKNRKNRKIKNFSDIQSAYKKKCTYHGFHTH